MKPLYLPTSCSNTRSEISIGYVVSLFFAFFFILQSYNLSGLVELTAISAVSFLFWVFLLIKKRGMIDVAVIFYILCYIFHSSYFLLIATDNVCGNAYLFIALPDDLQIRTLKYCNYFFNLFPIGSLIVNNKNCYKEGGAFLTIEQCGRLGITLMIITILPRLYVDVSRIYAFLLYGYKGTRALIVNNYIIMLANVFYVGVILALYGCKTTKNNKATFILLVSVLVVFLSMVSGARGTSVAYLVVVLYVYYKCRNVMITSTFSLLRYFVVFYFLLAVIATFGDARESGLISISNYIELFVRNATYKLFIDQLGELGFAAYTLAGSIDFFPNQGFGYGSNYILSWFAVFPNIGDALTGFYEKMSFVVKLPKQYQGILGGSVLGEFFYNFGYFSLIIYPLFGYVVTSISNCVNNAMKGSYLTSKELISILTIMPMLLWIRSCFNEFPRTIVWPLLFVWLVNELFHKKKQ